MGFFSSSSYATWCQAYVYCYSPAAIIFDDGDEDLDFFFFFLLSFLGEGLALDRDRLFLFRLRSFRRSDSFASTSAACCFASAARSGRCFFSFLAHLRAILGRDRSECRKTLQKLVVEAKFWVTAMVKSRLRTLWYHPAGTKIVSPGCCKASIYTHTCIYVYIYMHMYRLPCHAFNQIDEASAGRKV